jgi:hypothetical protein
MRIGKINVKRGAFRPSFKKKLRRIAGGFSAPSFGKNGS